jgi:dienelactone hydrolase
MARALDGVDALPDGMIVAGFSNGAGMAEHVASHRHVSGVVLLSGALPLSMLGADTWPHDSAVQLHYSTDDPFRNEDWITELTDSVQAAKCPFEFYEYPGDGHLFTDASRPSEYNAANTETLLARVLRFCEERDRQMT